MCFNLLLKNVEKEYFFGIGGIGDFLLLMSEMYDLCEQDQYDVVFVCNNMNTIRRIAKLFDRVERFWLFPRSAFILDKGIWDKIEKSAKGTGVTPYQFRYVDDWIKCGKSNVFEYYGINLRPDWATRITDKQLTRPCVVIQPFGGDNDLTKKKEIPYKDLCDEIEKFELNGWDIVLIGSEEDTKKHGLLSEYKWVVDFKDSYYTILKANKFIGTDSWGKTLAGLAGISTKIYSNKYDYPLENMFGHSIDPSDYVFLKDWGFDYADGRNF